MGKRSNFARRPGDFYATPQAAVLPLIPYLRGSGIRTFAEPCAGAGDLVRHLERLGLACTFAGDIASGQDAAELTAVDCNSADAIITNPPWSREVLHRLIAHFQNIAPTWLLLDSDWAQTKQAAPFLPSCSDIAPIGRVKWIEGSKHTGKDNAGWFRFDARHRAGPVFHWRDQGAAVRSRRTRTCAQCGKAYQPQRSSARFCSPACRQSAWRRRLSVTVSVTAAAASSTAIEPADSSGEEFRYVRHHDVARFEADGWERLGALDQTHHGEYSALMRRSLIG